MSKRRTAKSDELYKFYLEHSKYKMSKAEWMEMLKTWSTYYFNYLGQGGVFYMPIFMGIMRFKVINISKQQIDWNSSKKKYEEIHGKPWVKGDSLKDCFVYFSRGATIKKTFALDWDKRAANTSHMVLWRFEMSSRFQWKRLLKMFTDFPSLFQTFLENVYTRRHHKGYLLDNELPQNDKDRQRTELRTEDDN